ncbi:Serine/threonine protein kinase and signal transduction histidine kinase with GAF sensor (modular protein) [Planktothrix sp. PCC 11201]|uniref:AAA family ATPase n=1 Tax=Planktothrix sp. PCC 11201 TaxID=1729650 RepID=UPI000917D2AF|nr:AAA family ATPase [Planktothrix sp. PCC 11201]SKB14683.1 Serine/threonine protein kinase and signal transduction histidine kinase with GAF sensor (modular protein) [Planktothrix sp. PCC 11201]
MITLPGYQILNPIYNGSRTLVYRGIRLSDQRPVVIKLLRSEYPTVASLIEFRNQYRITKNLNIAGIVPILDLEPYANGFALIMEDQGYISLADYWASRELILGELLRISIEITRILEQLYRHQIIHKDVKLQNILVHPETLKIQLIDFSISTQLDHQNQETFNPQGLEGTLAYMSPEQTGRTNRGIDYRTDLYSLGVTLYQLFTRKLPFQSSEPLELIHAHLALLPLPLIEIKPSLPLMLNNIILKLMAKNPEERYQTPLGLLNDLEFCLEQWETIGDIPLFPLATMDLNDRFIIPDKFYGRQPELARLSSIFPEIQSKIILITGQSGIGKSSLVQEFYQKIIRNQGYFISGKFDQFRNNTPFGGWVQGIKQLIQQILTETPAKVEDWKSKLIEALGEKNQVLVDVIPELKSLLNQQVLTPELEANLDQNQFNHLILKLIQVFAQPPHPLIIFLDDLQWADIESLRLIQVLMSPENSSQSLVLILAYRDQEIGETHPLRETLQTLENLGTPIEQIVLNPLEEFAINQMIAETLVCSLEFAQPLTELVSQQTQGNPLFVRQFLQSLYTEKLIWFHPPQSSFGNQDLLGGWQCDLTEIKTRFVNPNILDLIIYKLQQLPEATQEILRFAACLGHQFNAFDLATVTEISYLEILQALEVAAQVQLIVSVKEIYPFYSLEMGVGLGSAFDPDETLPLLQSGVDQYKFIHDRIQQAAYLLIPSSQRQATHLKIGQLLLNQIQKQFDQPIETILTELLPEKLLNIINQFNLGVGLIKDQKERHQLALFNLIAGRKAKITTAYPTAVGHLAIGMGLLTANSWETDYQLTLELYTEAAEVAALSQDFESLNDWGKTVLERAKTLSDQVRIYELLIQGYRSQHQDQNAVNLALAVCQQLGVSLGDDSPLESWQELKQNFINYLAGRSPLELLDLPELSDPNLASLFTILTATFPSAYLTLPEQFPLWVIKLVNLSCQRGNTALSSLVYAAFGFVLCTQGEIELGNQMGELALELSAKLGNYELKINVKNLVYTLIKPYKYPLKNLLSPLELYPFQYRELGNIEQGYCLAQSYIEIANIIGKNISELESEIEHLLNQFRDFKSPSELMVMTRYDQKLQILNGKLELQTLLKFSIHAETQIQKMSEIGHSPQEIPFQLALNFMILTYRLGKFQQAREWCQQAELYLDRQTYFVFLPIFYCYQSLIHLNIYSESSAEQQSQILEKVSLNLKKLKIYSTLTPVNFSHYFYLVEAEYNRISRNYVKVMEAFEQAIDWAKTHQFIQEEALGYELAAQFYLDWGKEKIARVYLIDAYYGYAHWGAFAKVKDLESRYPQLLDAILEQIIVPKTGVTISTNTEETIISSSNGGSAALDLATVTKASQALSQEIDLEQLLKRLIQVVIQNAGAQKCCIVLSKSGNLVIEAIARLNPLNGESIEINSLLQSLPIEESENLPLLILNTVIQTQEFVILADARQEPRYRHDPYLEQHQSKSILMTPIQNRGKLIGILYLENNLTTAVFTPERLEVLKILFSQAAISIDNAKLYSQVRNNERQMTQFLEGIPVGVAVLDPTGKPYYTNQKAQELLKTKVIPGVVCDALSNIYQAYLNGSENPKSYSPIPDYHFSNSTRDTTFILEVNQGDETILIENWVTPTYDEQGDLAYAILAFQDITKRQQTERALRQAEEKYRSIFENASEGLFQTTPTGRYISANPALARILGYDSPWDLMSMITNVQEEIYVDYERRQDFKRLIDQQGEVSGFEFKAYRKDGSIIWISENARAVFNEQNQLLYYEGFVVDITERKQAEEERIQFMQRLSELNLHLDEALDSEFELTDAAARFVPHEFLSFLGYESIVEVQLGAAVQKEMSILFADIRDFTSLSEDMTPEDNFKFINAFLSRMEPAIVDNYGFIDKYIGDEIMALFGGSADDSVRAGVEMITRLNDYNETRQRPGRPPIKIGIGINTGGLMLGIVGGKNRLDSTVISDSVNVASRIENLTKNYGVSLLITHWTFMALEDANQYAIRIIDRVKVKGKSDAVTVYEVFDADLPGIKAGKLVTKTTFEYGLMQYYLERYPEAAKLFQECLDRNPQDQVAQIYLERCLSKMS